MAVDTEADWDGSVLVSRPWNGRTGTMGWRSLPRSGLARAPGGFVTFLKAAVIGLGVGEQHIEGFERHSACRVTVLCDIDHDRLAAVGARHPGRSLVSDPGQVLCDPNIDVVSIASYDDAHFQQVVTALEHGKHVFVEKPLCQTDVELDGIYRALLRHRGLRLSSNLPLRRVPRFLDLRARILSGAMGPSITSKVITTMGACTRSRKAGAAPSRPTRL
ncbi:gfo/Idh/MocA family oxidoreductase (plasmid) [Azospirillum brasilense]|uniref:Gfo/Idh/MocA family oxidoreductase n=1 Tax=Azospirillum brasilense TaxID=192 RepID=A0A4D8RAS1_AZOBR|nr:Gfo/Idh/MocA family oxidoreductase [Azospirillum brasilense]QCO19887.1 gfo/Idh/MocA family oxidoreductase [Azospirillum brasilense]